MQSTYYSWMHVCSVQRHVFGILEVMHFRFVGQLTPANVNMRNIRH